MGKASYGVDRNGAIEKLSVKELAAQYWGFCNQYGVLYRLTEKDAYLVIIAGNITQYVRAGQCTGTLNRDSTFTLLFGMNGQGGYLDYASKGVNGEIVELDAHALLDTWLVRPSTVQETFAIGALRLSYLTRDT